MVVNTEFLAEHIYNHLMKKGYEPTEEQCLELADVFLDMMIDFNLMDEIDLY